LVAVSYLGGCINPDLGGGCIDPDLSGSCIDLDLGGGCIDPDLCVHSIGSLAVSIHTSAAGCIDP
jgi:hypothetical protein